MTVTARAAEHYSRNPREMVWKPVRLIVAGMKPTANPPSEAQRARAEAIVEERIDALFRRWPMLCGFYLQKDLEVSELAVHTWPGSSAGKDLYEELEQTLAELVDERPDAVELLRSRTFARALH